MAELENSSTAIILRSGEKSSFVGDNSIRPRELVYATDTQEIGSLKGNGEPNWEKWLKTEPRQNHFIGTSLPGREFGFDGDRFFNTNTKEEYKKESGEWVWIAWGETEAYIDARYEPKNNFPFGYEQYLGKYSYEFEEGYLPQQREQVCNRRYLVESIANLGSFIKQDGSAEFDEGYYPQNPKDLITIEYMLSGDLAYVLPTTNPNIYGALWNNNGEVVLSEPESSHFRIWTDGPISLKLTSGIWTVDENTVYGIETTLYPNNGFVDLTGHTDSQWGIKQDFWSSEDQLSYRSHITKIEVFKWGKIQNFKNSFWYLSNLTEFRVLDTNASEARSFEGTFMSSGLVTIDEFEFPKCNTCRRMFYYTKLTSVPDFDFSNVLDMTECFFRITSTFSFNNSHGFAQGSDLTSIFSNSRISYVGVVDFSGVVNLTDAFSYTPNLYYFYGFGFQDVKYLRNAWRDSNLWGHFEIDDLSSAKDLEYAFYGTRLRSFPLIENFGAQIDMETDVHFNGVEISHMFENCTYLTSFPAIDFSLVSAMSYVFKGCTSLVSTNFPSGTFDVTFTPVRNYWYYFHMDGMFEGCTSLVSAPKVHMTFPYQTRKMSSVFKGCTSLVDIDGFIDRWDRAYYTDYLFYGCTALVNLPLNFTLDGSSKIQYTFANTGISDFSRFSLPPNASDLSGTFLGSLIIEADFDFSNVTILANTFENCQSLRYVSHIKPLNSCKFNDTFKNSSIECLGGIDTSNAYRISQDVFLGTDSLIRPNLSEIDLILYKHDWVNPIDCSEIIT